MCDHTLAMEAAQERKRMGKGIKMVHNQKIQQAYANVQQNDNLVYIWSQQGDVGSFGRVRLICTVL